MVMEGHFGKEWELGWGRKKFQNVHLAKICASFYLAIEVGIIGEPWFTPSASAEVAR